jgi:tetraprenyl-beta-curcumene synthase
MDSTMTPAATPPAPTGSQASKILEPVSLGVAFAAAARRYWIAVFPLLRREVRHWRERADQIPDPDLRELALSAGRKHGNLEGAAAFAAFVPRAHRRAVVRALVAFQQAYNYLDLLAEQPRADPVAGARGLHQALLDALDSLDPALGAESTALAPGAARLDLTARGEAESPGWVGAGSPDYYARYPQREDNGYLSELVDTCRTALRTLPSYTAVAASARTATQRIVEFQSLNLATSQGDHDAFTRWARAETPPGTDLEWWEAAAAGGSSLGVYALIATAAAPVVDASEVRAIEDAYFPWICGLHSLLDHLVDRTEDVAAGQRNLIDNYASSEQATVRMRTLARRSADAAQELSRLQGRRHSIVLAGMAGNYLSDPGAAAPDAAPIAQHVRAAIGELMAPTLIVFKARRLAGGPATPSTITAPRPRPVQDERASPIALRLGR